MTTLDEAYEKVERFKANSLSQRIAKLQEDLQGDDKTKLASIYSTADLHPSLLDSALALKQASNQISEVVHATGILLSLPHILNDGEYIESLSLAAGNIGKQFDLETTVRVAEFKFIDWKGGSESIRQNQLFKDFYWLAEDATQKAKYLYVLGKQHPLKFFNGSRKLTSVLSRNNKLQTDFEKRYGDRYDVVHEYYEYRQHEVILADLLEEVPYFNT